MKNKTLHDKLFIVSVIIACIYSAHNAPNIIGYFIYLTVMALALKYIAVPDEE